MSMIGNYVMTDSETIEQILSGELSAEDILYDEDDNEPEDFIDIDKSWHAIHFTLTGEIDEGDEDNPLSKVVMNGQLLGDEDVGYGPPMYLTVSEVKETNEALQAVSNDDFAAKFDLAAMQENEIYPIIDDENPDEFLEYCLSYFGMVKEFFEKAAAGEKCIIFFLN